MRNEQLQAVFQRHWEAFLSEMRELDDTPENRVAIIEAVQAVAKNHPAQATDLGAALAQHWQPFISRLLGRIESETKKHELIATFQRLLLAQTMDLSAILASDMPNPEREELFR